jgi:hypothetical protein
MGEGRQLGIGNPKFLKNIKLGNSHKFALFRQKSAKKCEIGAKKAKITINAKQQRRGYGRCYETAISAHPFLQ